MSEVIAVIVAGVICHGDDVLLVCQQGPDDPEAFWALPGGVVERCESLTEALIREVKEETGLLIRSTGPVAFVSEIRQDAEGVIPLGVGRSSRGVLALTFDIVEWEGEIVPDDPDAFVSHAAFLPRTQAIQRLQRVPFRPMWEPIVAHLTGSAAPGTLWSYRRSADGEIEPTAVEGACQ